MRVHLVDGTYELFRHFYGPVPGHRDPDGVEVGAIRGVLGSLVGMLEQGATHVGIATDHVVESFRNDLWPGYKTGEGVDPELMAQFEPLEDCLRAAGFTVWAMVDQEADDALAAAATIAAADDAVEEVVVCTPDKDLGQCVGGKVVQLDRRNQRLLDVDGVREKFGVEPASIPDWLALVGDSADGFPGLPGWGAKSASAVLARWRTIEAIPDDPARWDVTVRGAAKLAATLAAGRELVGLFKVLATLRTDADVGRPEQWRWRGPETDFDAWCERLGAAGIRRRIDALVVGRPAAPATRSGQESAS
jgi:5'-3' exonuclease